MFKRVLVLVVFLFGVFWWLTSRDETPAENDPEVVTVETENTEAENLDSEPVTEPETEVETDTEETPTPTTPAEIETTPEPTTSNNNTVETSTESQTDTSSTANNNTSASTNATTTTPEPMPTPVVNTTTTTPPAPVAPVAPVVPDRMTDVTVYVYEWGLDLSDKTIPAGTINFQVQNDGRFTHDFNVSGFGNLGKVTPSEEKTFTVKLAAGDYEAFSERRQDYERGVTETFTVVE